LSTPTPPHYTWYTLNVIRENVTIVLYFSVDSSNIIQGFYSNLQHNILAPTGTVTGYFGTQNDNVFTGSNFSQNGVGITSFPGFPNNTFSLFSNGNTFLYDVTAAQYRQVQFFTANQLSNDPTCTITAIPASPSLLTATFNNRSILIHFTSETSDNLIYSLNRGMTWQNSSFDVSANTLQILDLSASSVYNVGLETVINNVHSNPSNFITVTPLTLQELQNANKTNQEILAYGYQTSDLSLNASTAISEVLAADPSTNIQSLKSYGLSYAEIRRYGDFTIDDFLAANVDPQVLPPGRPTVVSAQYYGKGKTNVVLRLEDTLTPAPTEYDIYVNYVLVDSVPASQCTINSDGTISVLVDYNF
jgi:hypothetical protein